jgi:U4/U6.U5 tri-snRNP-associated protein 1
MRDVNRNASTSVDSGANVQYVNGKADDSSVSKIVVDSRTTNNLTAGSEPDEDDDEDWESARNQRMEQTDNDKLDDEFIMDIEEEDDDDDDGGDGDEDVADDEQLAFLHRQPTFSKGLGATLALLKGSGELNKPKLQAGRARDQRDSDQGQDKSGIQLEYRDEYGNKLTKKEEFRRLSYQFHGQGPGKKKLEKRMKAQKALMRAGVPKAGVLDGTAGTMKSLHRALEATGQSHVMLQGGVTTDPKTINALALELMKKKEKKEKQRAKEAASGSNSKK